MNLSVNNPPKALIVLMSLICVTTMIIAGAIAPSEGLPIITLIVGYGIGNGIAARAGEPVTPIIGPSRNAGDELREVRARLERLDTDRARAVLRGLPAESHGE